MYLSHNITNNVVEFEINLYKIKNTITAQELAKFSAQVQTESLISLAGVIGISMNFAEAEEIRTNRDFSITDVKTQLLENILLAMDYVGSIASNENIPVSLSHIEKINQILGKSVLDDWKKGFRLASDPPGIIFDNFRKMKIEASNKLDPRKQVYELLTAYGDNRHIQRIIRIADIVGQMIRIQPFHNLNELSILLIAQLYLHKYLGESYTIINVIDLLRRNYLQLGKIFEAGHDKALENFAEWFISNAASELATRINSVTQQASEEYQVVNGNSAYTHTGNASNKVSKPFLDLNNRQIKILKYLQSIPSVKREDYVDMMGVSSMTAYRDLKNLLDKRLIKTYGRGRGTKYLLYSR